MHATTATIPAANFKRLVALITWYDQAPNERFGDFFHDRVDEIISDLLPNITEVDNDTHYISTQEVDGDLVRVFLFPVETDTNDHFTVEIVSD